MYHCTNCDSQFPKWQGRCSECGAWGTLGPSTEKLESKKTAGKILSQSAAEVTNLDEIKSEEFPRFKTEIEEFDRVLGGGIVPGSLVLIGGDPGIGKSTLILQIAAAISNHNSQDVLYVSGEESGVQIKMRAERLNLKTKNLKFLSETNIETICATMAKLKPSLAIVDSIQTMTSLEFPSPAGSVNQVRVATVKLLETAKQHQVATFIIGHVTKEGLVAGPKTLEHLVDTVLYLEGDRFHAYRLLRTVKNRFGAVSEVGIFDMQTKGLIEVKNPSEAFIEGREKTAGSIITCVMEGTRPFLVEIQALVTPTSFPSPQRRSAGFDLNRLQLLSAVLSRRLGLKLGNQDIHLNVVGGFKIQEPAADLAAALALISAYKNKALDSKIVAFGEVGLGGEVRTVNQMEKRIAEAQKLGFGPIMIPFGKNLFPKTGAEIVRVKNLREAIP